MIKKTFKLIMPLTFNFYKGAYRITMFLITILKANDLTDSFPVYLFDTSPSTTLLTNITCING